MRHDFESRVNFAAAVISRDGAKTRNFDTCFEMYDGDEVVTLLYRRSLTNPKLAENLWKGLCPASVMPAVERLAHIPTKEMSAEAARTRKAAQTS